MKSFTVLYTQHNKVGILISYVRNIFRETKVTLNSLNGMLYIFLHIMNATDKTDLTMWYIMTFKVTQGQEWKK